MTDNTHSPKQASERIWLGAASDENEHEVWLEPDEGGIEYVRADIHTAAIKRQAGASKALRENVMHEVRHLQEKDRSEYFAAKTLDGERDANAALTDENEKLSTTIAEQVAVIEQLKEALLFISNEVAGLSAFEAELRAGIGHTNWNALTHRVEKSRELLATLAANKTGEA